MYKGMRLPVLTLEKEYQAYRITERIKKASEIKKYIDGKKQKDILDF